jgi:hypothetical protein
MRLFIYIPWTKSGFLTFFTYTLNGLFAKNVFAFYALSYSDTSQALGNIKDNVHVASTGGTGSSTGAASSTQSTGVGSIGVKAYP